MKPDIRFLVGWAATLAIMFPWIVLMYFSGPVARSELLQQVTFSFHHMIVEPLVVGLAVAVPNLSFLPAEGENGRIRCQWRRRMWCAAVVVGVAASAVESYQYLNGATVSLPQLYEVSEESLDNESVQKPGKERLDKVERDLRKTWRDSWARDGAAPDKDEKKAHALTVDIFNKRLGSLIPRSSHNWMPLANCAVTAVVAFIMLYAIVARIWAKQIAYRDHLRGTATPGARCGVVTDTVVIWACFLWIPLRGFANWHEKHWENLGAGAAGVLNPFDLFAVALFIGCIIFLWYKGIPDVEWFNLTLFSKVNIVGLAISLLSAVAIYFLGANHAVTLMDGIEESLYKVPGLWAAALVVGSAYVGYAGWRFVKDQSFAYLPRMTSRACIPIVFPE